MILLISFLEIISSTFTRLIILFVALGYQIVIKSVRKYHVKIALIFFMYVVALAIKLLNQYIRQDHKISSSVNFITQLPVALINCIIFFWTILAFNRTLTHLLSKSQQYKYTILYRLFFSFTLTLLSTVILFIAELASRRKNANLDHYWKSNVFWEISYFLVTTVFTVRTMWILYPTEMSKELS